MQSSISTNQLYTSHVKTNDSLFGVLVICCQSIAYHASRWTRQNCSGAIKPGKIILGARKGHVDQKEVKGGSGAIKSGKINRSCTQWPEDQREGEGGGGVDVSFWFILVMVLIKVTNIEYNKLEICATENSKQNTN